MTDLARVSVTEVRNALRCPRIFALGRSRRRVVSFPVGSSCMGGPFHRIVARFAQTVSQPPAAVSAIPAAAGAADRERALSAWLLDFLVTELESNALYASMPAEVDDLAEALRQLGGYLARRCAEGPLARAVADLVLGSETPIEASLPEAGVVVTGKIDALYANPRGGTEVVEYKLTAEANDPLDLAQVALYRELRRRAQGVAADAVVLRFNPQLTEARLGARQADALVGGRLVPLLRDMAGWANRPETAPATGREDLCASCPMFEACVTTYRDSVPPRDSPPGGATRGRPDPSGVIAMVQPPATPQRRDEEDAGGNEEARVAQKRILEELRKDGVTADVHDVKVGPTIVTIAMVRPRGAVADLDRAGANVVHRLSAESIEVTYNKEGARRQFVVRRKTPRTVLLAPLLDARRDWLAERPGRFVVGVTPDGRILTASLADPATPHLLVAGQAGSGKSWLLKSLVASLVHWHAPAAVRITLLDPKRVTFNQGSFMTGIAAHLDGPLLYGAEDAMPCLERYTQLMDERYGMFEAEHVADLDEYNDAVAVERRLPRHVIVVDEFQDLTADKKTSEEFCRAVGRLGAKARAAGVHLILATQRPDAKNVPSTLKSNLGGKIALRVANAVNSRVILDQAGAELLLGRGDLLADLGQGVERAQGPVVAAP